MTGVDLPESVSSDGVRKLGPGLAQASGQIRPVGIVDPPVEASLKQRHPNVSKKCGGCRFGASPNQFDGECPCDGCELGPAPLLQSGLRAITSRRWTACEATGTECRSDVAKGGDDRFERGDLRVDPSRASANSSGS